MPSNYQGKTCCEGSKSNRPITTMAWNCGETINLM